MKIDKLEKVNLIYGENFSGKTKFLKELYLEMNTLSDKVSEYTDFKTNTPTIYIPVNRIDIETDKTYSISQEEYSEYYDYLIQRREKFLQRNLKFFYSSLVKKEVQNLKDDLEEIFKVSLPQDISEYSDGVLSILTIMSELEEISKYNKSTLVLIDELDSFLFPQQQVSIIDKLLKRYPQNTYIITTHSSLLRKDVDCKIGEYRIENNNLKKVYLSEKKQYGYSKLRIIWTEKIQRRFNRIFE